MKLSRLAPAGPLIAAAALLGAACVGVKNPEGWASPSLEDSTAYYFPAKDRLEAIDLGASPATVSWKFPDKQKFPEQDKAGFEAVYSDPIVDGDNLYFASYDGKVFAVRRSDGGLRWELKDPIDGSVAGGPALAGDFLAFGTTSGKLYVVNKSDGSPAPNWPREGRRLAGDGIWASPVYKDGILYVATMGGEVYALDAASSAPTWERPYRAGGAIASLALVDDTHLFVPSLNSQVVIVDIKTGQAVNAPFNTSDWVWMNPAVSGSTVYFADFSGEIYALDITSNKELWPPISASSKVKSSPVIVDDVLVVATRQPAVLFIDSRTGASLNKVPIQAAGTVRADLAIHDGKPLIVTTDGKLFEADLRTRSVAELPVSRGQ